MCGLSPLFSIWCRVELVPDFLVTFLVNVQSIFWLNGLSLQSRLEYQLEQHQWLFESCDVMYSPLLPLPQLGCHPLPPPHQVLWIALCVLNRTRIACSVVKVALSFSYPVASHLQVSDLCIAQMFWCCISVYVPRNLRICAISRLRCAFSESRDCAL